MNKNLKFLVLILFSGILVSAGETLTRPFYMGFTPWPYDATISAVEDTYSKIDQYGDMVSHHLGGGIPWQEALDGKPYSDHLNNEMNGRINSTTRPVFLSIEVLNSQRDGLAPYWGDDVNLPLEGDWASRSFSDQNVIDAYVRFALDMIARFEPVYFNYGVEASDLMFSNPQGFSDFVVFASQVYPRIKATFPELKLLVSAALKTPSSASGILMQEKMKLLVDYVDIVGVSVYGYVFFDHNNKGNPDQLPGNWLSQVLGFSNGKPIAIAETGWIAENMVIDEFGVSVVSNASFQRAYVERLLTEAKRFNMEFVVWFTIVDFDALWSGALGEDPVAAIWRDTGLFDHQLNPRPALESWSTWRSKSIHEYVLPHLASSWNNYLLVDQTGVSSAAFSLETFDEQGTSLGITHFQSSFFLKVNLTDQFPQAHSGIIRCEQDSLGFRLVYIEPEEKGLAEFSLAEGLFPRLQFTFPIFGPNEASLTWKGLALFSHGPGEVQVSLLAFDQNGSSIGETSLNLKSKQRIRGTLESLFPDLTQEQSMQVVRITATTEQGQLAGLNISGNGNRQLLFTKAKP